MQGESKKLKSIYLVLIFLFQIPLCVKCQVKSIEEDWHAAYQSNDDSWRQAANQRIDSLRKGDIILQIELDSKHEKPLTISLEQIAHDFAFGTAIDALDYIKLESYASIVDRYFNEVVFENDLKWKQWYTQSQEVTMKAMIELHQKGKKIRGHTLLWAPILDYDRLKDVMDLETYTDKQKFIFSQLQHINQLLNVTKPYIQEWDAINHLVSIDHKNKLLLEDKYGIDLYRKVFALKEQEDLKFYVNESKVLTQRGEKFVLYFDKINQLALQGIKPDGIGFMSHFELHSLPAIPTVYQKLELFSQLGMSMKVTEFDVQYGQRGRLTTMPMHLQALQASFTKDFMRICFSHPKVSGFLFWGFWEENHWYPNAALWTSQGNLKPNGEAFLDLVYNEWWTKENKEFQDSGIHRFRGFKGTYKLMINLPSGETLFEKIFPLKDSSIEISLYIQE